MKKILFIFILANLLVFPAFLASAHETSAPFPADNEKIKVLLVPGHDAEVWGAQYEKVKEAYMNLAVARRIYDILKTDKRFDVYVTRGGTGYTQEFSDYFYAQEEEIPAFIERVKKEMEEKIKSGEFSLKDNPPHNKASEDVAIRLYGFNKWANENGVDAVIHLHFNDYPRPYSWTIGTHKGFAIYIPEEQMANSDGSALLAANIFMQLEKKYSKSTYEKEIGGLVPDQTLIALGSNGSLLPSVRSILIEYGYIYEKIFRNYTTRHQAYDDMAKLTAAGIKKYFFQQ